MQRDHRNLAAATFVAFLFALVSLLPAHADRHMVLPVHPAPLVAETAGGERAFTIEIADTFDRRQRGLMFREEMEASHGMLFVFEQTQPTGFWMKNTPLPLDLIFIGEDGLVRTVGQGEPFSEDVIPSFEPVRFVLELNAGVAEQAGIGVGTRIRHPIVEAVAGGG